MRLVPGSPTPDYWDEAVPYLLWLMDRDRKSTALKSLQGRIWKGGFEYGDLKGTLFTDVPAALERWSANGHVAIYSSGLRCRAAAALPSFDVWRSYAVDFRLLRYAHRAEDIAGELSSRLPRPWMLSRARFCSFPTWCGNWTQPARPAVTRGWYCGRGMRRSRMHTGIDALSRSRYSEQIEIVSKRGRSTERCLTGPIRRRPR